MYKFFFNIFAVIGRRAFPVGIVSILVMGLLTGLGTFMEFGRIYEMAVIGLMVVYGIGFFLSVWAYRSELVVEREESKS